MVHALWTVSSEFIQSRNNKENGKRDFWRYVIFMNIQKWLGNGYTVAFKEYLWNTNYSNFNNYLTHMFWHEMSADCGHWKPSSYLWHRT